MPRALPAVEALYPLGICAVDEKESVPVSFSWKSRVLLPLKESQMHFLPFHMLKPPTSWFHTRLFSCLRLVSKTLPLSPCSFSCTHLPVLGEGKPWEHTAEWVLYCFYKLSLTFVLYCAMIIQLKLPQCLVSRLYFSDLHSQQFKWWKKSVGKMKGKLVMK